MKFFFSFCCSILFSIKIFAQVSVVNIQLMPYNITPESMLGVSVLNSGNAQQVQLISTLYNFNGEQLLAVKSNVFQVNNGLNAPFDGSRKVISAQYSSGNQANYLKTTNGLPSGAYKVCVSVLQGASSEILDEFCDEIESSFNQYLYLVSPFDKDTIETKTPLLIWAHSEPFSVLTQGESYRMIVSEMKPGQSPEEAITVNSSVLNKNYLTVHSVQYPIDAPALLEGKSYAWQVQKLANGVITNKTEAWQFVVASKLIDKEIKYVALKSSVDANYYTAYNGKIYFKFLEEYTSKGNMIARVKDEAGNYFDVIVRNDSKANSTSSGTEVKSMGDNRFILNLDASSLKKGFYLLEIKNEKKEIYYLKFYYPG